jgi:hypothetical protein
MSREINGFPLAWRWTDPAHAVLPPEVLNQLVVVTAEGERAGALFDQFLCGGFVLVPPYDEDVRSLEVGTPLLRPFEGEWPEELEDEPTFAPSRPMTEHYDRPEELRARVGDWLRRQHRDGATEVTVRWTQGAVRMPWSVFTEHWSDFCYVLDDTTLVWPPGAGWVLYYEGQDDAFYFGPGAASDDRQAGP